ncbi:hypothetical protein HYS48_00120 [Candidatus Woesearchaeota archaeon]|nr:hypothetical protein [Candidatus Woesearchaeota archaeon]
MAFGKRAQNALFVLLIMLIFLGLVGMIYHIDNLIKQTKQEKVFIDDTLLTNMVTSCMATVGIEAIQSLARRGGFLENLPEKTVEVPLFGDIPLYTDLDYYFIPSISFMESQLGKEMDRALPGCVEDFESTEYQIMFGEPETKAEIQENNIIFETSYPITLQKGKATQKVDVFEAALGTNLGVVHDFVEAYLEKQKEKPFIRLSVLQELLEQYDLHLELLQANQQDVVLRIYHPRAMIDSTGSAYPEFLFAIRYGSKVFDSSFAGISILTGEEINRLGLRLIAKGDRFILSDTKGIIQQQRTGNRPPILQKIPNQYADIGNLLRIRIPASDPDRDKLSFDFTPKLPGMEIDALGFLVWGPTIYQEVTVTITVCDKEYCVSQLVKFTVGKELPIPNLERYADMPQKQYQKNANY